MNESPFCLRNTSLLKLPGAVILPVLAWDQLGAQWAAAVIAFNWENRQFGFLLLRF